MNWFHELGSLELAAFVVGVVALLSIVGVALVAPRVRSSRLHEHFDNGTIAGLLSALIGVYAVAAGLTAVAVWSNLVDAGSDVSREAAAIAVLYHDLGGYPPPVRQQGRRALIAYTKYVINVEWPLHQKGELPRDTLRIIDKAQQALVSFEPVSEGQKILQAQVLRSYNQLLQAHWQRLQAVRDTALPAELWIVVILLGAIAISSCFLLRVDSFTMHATVTLLVAAPIALVLYFIAVSDHPFQGGINVSPAPYREVLEKMLLVAEVEAEESAEAAAAAPPPPSPAQ
ncbi:MAG: hypothetical protein AW08_00943 [Candidatus Accumulibacter adjunctus]|uniref:DUF4239 domain-containing protein n=1 Tax=Candidatus Accumulibacter adjunctus TaxID=1454001 RepID=A0A011N184_9PROT|nr:MAG: hypothetical protein AW08_00943 [Candidatus Accumulibacter adjunctus]